MRNSLLNKGLLFFLAWLVSFFPAFAYGRSLEKKTVSIEQSKEDFGLYVRGAGESKTISIGDRDFILYTPAQAKPMGQRPLLIVLHGGLGSGEQIQKYIGLEPYADRYGFLIAYMNGTKVARALSRERKGWNAGACCGLPQKKEVDDVGYIVGAANLLVREQGVDPARIYGTGHSNGGMMTYRMLCEADLYRGAVIYAGVLELNVDRCPLASHKPILALHGGKDENVPFEGGHPTKGVNHGMEYNSQAYTESVFRNSGASFTSILLPEAEHRPETINAALLATKGLTLPGEIVSFLGLER